MRVILAFSLVLLLAGCASSGGLFERATPQERAAFDRANPDLKPRKPAGKAKRKHVRPRPAQADPAQTSAPAANPAPVQVKPKKKRWRDRAKEWWHRHRRTPR